MIIEQKFQSFPTKLSTFDRVLVRQENHCIWKADFFSHRRGHLYICVGGDFYECIPYKSNEHLLGTANECDEYYKTFE